MRARYLGKGAGQWKGVELTPFCIFDVPDHMQEIVARHPLFEVVEEQPKRRGRPPKHADT